MAEAYLHWLIMIITNYVHVVLLSNLNKKNVRIRWSHSRQLGAVAFARRSSSHREPWRIQVGHCDSVHGPLHLLQILTMQCIRCSTCTLTWTDVVVLEGHDQLLFGILSGIHFLACDLHISDISNIVRPKLYSFLALWCGSCPCFVFLSYFEVLVNRVDLQVAAVICLICSHV